MKKNNVVMASLFGLSMLTACSKSKDDVAPTPPPTPKTQIDLKRISADEFSGNVSMVPDAGSSVVFVKSNTGATTLQVSAGGVEKVSGWNANKDIYQLDLKPGTVVRSVKNGTTVNEFIAAGGETVLYALISPSSDTTAVKNKFGNQMQNAFNQQ